jgi:hypothetical protein
MEPLPAKQHSRGARRILVAAAAIHIALFVLEHRGTFAHLLAQPTVPPAGMMGPFAKGSDCIGYYAWLRSPLIDHDFQFDNEFATTIARTPDYEAVFPLTVTGHRSNPWPVGPAIIWAPAVVTVHQILCGLGRHSPWPADGYSPPYQLAVGGTTLALALLTLSLAYRIGRRFASPFTSAAAAALITLGTPAIRVPLAAVVRKLAVNSVDRARLPARAYVPDALAALDICHVADSRSNLVDNPLGHLVEPR